MIGIVDYKAGNLNSVMKAFKFLGLESQIISSVEDSHGVDKLVIPGVGSFGAAINNLKKQRLYEFVLDWLKADRPFLGICLGFQLLFEGSEESVEVSGFSVVEGKCSRIRGRKVPHIGWNKVRFVIKDPIVDGFNEEEYFYFVHSYAVLQTSSTVVGTTDYEQEFVSIVRSGNIYGVQFHPEKSGEAGLRLLYNWGTRC